ncbi:MAG TPA: TonB-dependent receptor [Acidobacteriota bacterium]|jgi:hypothetical protein
MKPFASRAFLVLIVAVILYCNVPVFGQAFTATLSGVVTDPQGALIPGVMVRVQNQATQDMRSTTSTDDGRYVLSQLLPGTYDVTAELPGFKTFKQVGFTLRANQSAELNISLQIGEVRETVQVTSKPVMLDTLSANQSSTLTEDMIKQLPTNVRSPLALVLTQAGTTPGIFGLPNNFTQDQNYSSFSLNGGRSMSTLILLDGAPATAADWGGLIVSPSIDSIQEMQIARNSYEAQFSKSGGGIVSLVSKGGSNNFHGTAFEFFRSENLDATSWGNNRNVVCPPSLTPHQCDKRKKGELKRHQVGGNLGGPIWRSRHLYFFGSYEGLRQTTPSSSGLRTVPTDLERQGDFSQTFNPNGSLAVIFNPFTTRSDPNNPGQFIRDAFPGNKIPANLIDPVAARVMSLYPKPNRPGDAVTNANNYFQVGSGFATTDKIDTRIDWAKSEKFSMFGRFSGRVRQKDGPPHFYGNGADIEKANNNPGWHISLDNTFAPNPTWVISVLVGASRWVEEQISASTGILQPSSVGLSDAQYQAPLLPRFQASGYATLGDTFSNKVRKFPRYTHTLQVNTSKELSHHSLKFGFWGEVGMVNNVDRFSGSFDFGRGFTAGPIASTSSSTSGNSLASMLLGTMSSARSPFQADIAGSMHYYAGYAQDTWRVNRRLTLTLGLRYEIQPAMTERFNRLSFFNPTIDNPLGQRVGLPLKGGFQFADADHRGAWKTDKNDWAPRLGLAYKLNDRLVVRAGYGIFYVPASSLITFDHDGQHLGFSTSTDAVVSVGGAGLVPLALLRDPFPQGLNQPTGKAAGLLTAVGQFPFQIWPAGQHPTGYKQNFSLDFQYELTPGNIVEVGYTGFRARKLVYGNPSLDINQLPTNLLSLGDALNEQVPNPFFGVITSGVLSGRTVARQRLLRPFPQFGALTLTRSFPGAQNNFDAFSARYTRQFSGGLMIISGYQWSKNLDDASEDQGWGVSPSNQWRDFYNRHADYSISSHDVPHSFVTSLVYDLPVGRGRKFGSTMPRAVEHVVGGWQLSSIVRVTSGTPVSPNANNRNGDYGFQRGYPNLVDSKLLKLDNRTPERWFNSCSLLLDSSGKPTVRSNCASASEPVAWIEAPRYTIGNAPRYLNRLRRDYYRNVDLTLAKNFSITETTKLQVRGDIFNLTNTPLFGSVNNSVGSSGFGQNLGTFNLPRQIQLGLKLNF